MAQQGQGIIETAKEKVASAAQAVKEAVTGGAQETATTAGQEGQGPAGLLESASDAAKHRKERGEEEPVSPHRSGLGRHIDIGGVADFGPVDTERNQQVDTRDIPARVP